MVKNIWKVMKKNQVQNKSNRRDLIQIWTYKNLILLSPNNYTNSTTISWMNKSHARKSVLTKNLNKWYCPSTTEEKLRTLSQTMKHLGVLLFVLVCKCLEVFAQFATFCCFSNKSIGESWNSRKIWETYENLRSYKTKPGNDLTIEEYKLHLSI